ncbi:EboA domain-containing protein [Aurantimonas sp. C2-6-R+9]|uniref:EboA domain-containing protein n=1 Tax=unclassified Aurantimonas TaxID=2638230 RepID=UPI002E199B0C|nr:MULTISPECIES: EboA domain-containing protein [unclassified Aurantimonas]MEC5292272.1 EboA domain-containing protein [Aurantimonas sp. C2-3-R2]MEC5382487.1 EboA domain-containing protein [Aurantimonas sp. C2-6-R+9]MEC5413357.1 EboA domain-containing protein [Aurantimonas sp. C2-4-R8]
MAKPEELLREWVLRQAGAEAGWVRDQLDALATGAPERDLHLFLGLAPRRLGKADLALSPEDHAAAAAARPGWRVAGWSIDGAARVLALLVHSGQRPFAERFKDLRRTADAAELVALYRGLPLYPDPASLSFEAGEGLRSNMRAVFEAIAHENPYPRENFDEHRWNHMILKALFVGSRLSPIQDLDERANPELARILREYAHERWSAGRLVTPELWRCVGPFAVDAAAIADLERALRGERVEAAAAALALAASPLPEARTVLAARPEAAAAIESGRLTWNSLEEVA